MLSKHSMCLVLFNSANNSLRQVIPTLWLKLEEVKKLVFSDLHGELICWGSNPGSLWFQNMSSQSLCYPNPGIKSMFFLFCCPVSLGHLHQLVFRGFLSLSLHITSPGKPSFIAPDRVEIPLPWGHLCYGPSHVLLSLLACVCVCPSLSVVFCLSIPSACHRVTVQSAWLTD